MNTPLENFEHSKQTEILYRQKCHTLHKKYNCTSNITSIYRLIYNFAEMLWFNREAEHGCIDENRIQVQPSASHTKKILWIYTILISDSTLIDDKLSGSFRERHCDGSLISVSFHILDFSTASSTILGFTSAKFRVSLFYNEKENVQLKTEREKESSFIKRFVCEETHNPNHGCYWRSSISKACSNSYIGRRKSSNGRCLN